MSDTILVGHKNQINPVPAQIWATHLAQAPQHVSGRLAFMTPAHHRVRYFVVKELPLHGRPLEPETIARALDLPLAQTLEILADLEQNLFFLVRDEQGAVSWAFPVTAEPTPHRLSFRSGERLYGA
jgi:hypothetical protein